MEKKTFKMTKLVLNSRFKKSISPSPRDKKTQGTTPWSCPSDRSLEKKKKT